MKHKPQSTIIPEGVKCTIINQCRELALKGYHLAKPFEVAPDQVDAWSPGLYHCVPMLLPHPCVQVFPIWRGGIQTNASRHFNVFNK